MSSFGTKVKYRGKEFKVLFGNVIVANASLSKFELNILYVCIFEIFFQC